MELSDGRVVVFDRDRSVAELTAAGGRPIGGWIVTAAVVVALAGLGSGLRFWGGANPAPSAAGG